MAQQKKQSQYGISERQKKFCDEYIIDLNGKQSAIKVGYSEKSAESLASRLLKNDKVKQYLAIIRAKVQERVEVRQDEILRILKDMAFADVTETMELTFTEIKQLPKALRLCIASHKKTETKELSGSTKIMYEIKFIDKIRAIDMLNKHIGFYDEDNKQKGTTIVVRRPTKDDEIEE